MTYLRRRLSKLEQSTGVGIPALPMAVVDLGERDPYGPGEPYAIAESALPALLRVYGEREYAN